MFNQLSATSHRDTRRPMTWAMASVGLVALMLPASSWAQEAPAEESAADSGEIIVTARREGENLQNVPVSVQVVTGEAIEKLAITSVEEISKLAPGLTLVNAGSNTSITLRGVTFQPGSGTPATPIYFNESPFDPAQTIVSLFDVGQIEVLRGPQGTSRGAPSISGAVTILTRKPDLKEFGGFVLGQYGEGDHRVVQGGINLPVIKDKLAIRLAANVEDSNGSRIESVNSQIASKFRDRSYRATVLFAPTDKLSIQAMYQRRRSLNLNFTQVVGTGSPGSAAVPGLRPATARNFNGPALTLADRASVQDRPSIVDQHLDLLTVNAKWQVLGHNVSYNFGRQFNRSPSTINATDSLNIIPGFETTTTVTNNGLPKFSTNEIRISSLPDPDRPFDYDIGYYTKRSGGRGINFGSPAFLTGAFGHPVFDGPGVVTTPNQRYVLNSTTNILIGQKFQNFYGNVRFHLDEKTELSGGIAILKDEVPVQLDIKTFAAFNAFANPLLPSRAFCPFALRGAIASPVYTTGVVCEVGLPDGFRNATQNNSDNYSKAIYNFSLSRQFSDDLLLYATTGTSFRSGLPAINNPGLPANLVTPKPETATSYEVGVKSSFGRSLRANLALFQLDYKNQLTTFEGVQYFNTVAGSIAQTSLAFYRNLDARVRGFELEVAARPIKDVSLAANLSYSKIKSRGGLIPVNDPTRPITAANPINLGTSPKGQVLNTEAPFQATINGSYEPSINDSLGAYFRFNVNYRGKNPNFGNFRTGGAFKSTPSFEIVDLFAGITGTKAGWEIGAYAKNIFDKQVEIARVATINSVYTNFAGAPGYDVVRSSRPREVGVTLRYAFGSR